MKAPEAHGISSADIEAFVRELNEHALAMHSVLLARGGDIVYEGYWKPFSADGLHRMNSVTKSFVGIAIGLLEEDGLLSLDDPLAKFFPNDLPHELSPLWKEQTVRQALTMQTSRGMKEGHWVRDKVPDRTKDYFIQTPTHPAGTLFRYDSAASFLLTRIVEDLTGKPFLTYLQERILHTIGFSENATCIQGNDGYSWGDSGLLCTTRDIFLFAEFLRLGGAWQGKRLMNEAYIRAATSCQTPTNTTGWEAHNTFGYGYQIWKSYDDGFAFLGRGDQLMICLPREELIFVCTADNQGNSSARTLIFDAFDRNIRKKLSPTPLPEAPDAYASLMKATEQLTLVFLHGEKHSPIVPAIQGRRIPLSENPMGILYLTFTFEDDKGCMAYENSTGKKVLTFGFGRNYLADFPEEGYPDMDIRDFTPGNYYPAATSAAWLDERTLAIRSFMIGKHLAALYITVGFRPDGSVGIQMIKNTNCFLHTYHGDATGHVC